jgi:hypothetical protein
MSVPEDNIALFMSGPERVIQDPNVLSILYELSISFSGSSERALRSSVGVARGSGGCTMRINAS